MLMIYFIMRLSNIIYNTCIKNILMRDNYVCTKIICVLLNPFFIYIRQILYVQREYLIPVSTYGTGLDQHNGYLKQKTYVATWWLKRLVFRRTFR